MKGLIFTYVMTYGGSVVALFDPYFGFLIYVCFAIVKPEALWHWSVPEGNYSRIVATALLVGWFAKGCGNWRFGRATAVVATLVGYWVWMVAATAHTPVGEPAWPFVESMAKVVLPFVVGITLLDSLAKLKQLTWVIAISQSYVALEFNLSYFSGINVLQEFGFAGMDNNSVAIALVTCSGLTFFLALDSSKWLPKTVAFACTALLVHAVMFSFSRGALLGLIITGLAVFILIPKKMSHYVVFAVAVLIAFQMAGKEVRERFFTAFADQKERDGSAQNRVDYWGYCWVFMQQEPLFGIGPRQFASTLPRRFYRTPAEAHNQWLQTGAEMGLPGLLFLAGFYSTCIIRVWQLRRKSAVDNNPAFAGMACMVIAALTGFATSAAFVSLYGLELPFYVALIGAGLLKLSSASAVPAADTDEAPAQDHVEPELLGV